MFFKYTKFTEGIIIVEKEQKKYIDMILNYAIKERKDRKGPIQETFDDFTAEYRLTVKSKVWDDIISLIDEFKNKIDLNVQYISRT